MADLKYVLASALELDIRNPRFRAPMASEQEALVEIVKRNAAHSIALMGHIVKNGFDPLSTIGVIASENAKRYIALEGNRRIAALLALEEPSRVAAQLSAAQQKTVATLSAQYHKQGVPKVMCAIFASREEAEPWIVLKHTGLNGGTGIFGWETGEKDRLKGGGKRITIDGQALDFLEARGVDTTAADGVPGYTTTLRRILNYKPIREHLGLEFANKTLSATNDPKHVADGLQFIVDQLRTGEWKVKHAMHEPDRKRLLTAIKKRINAPAKPLDEPTPLAELPATVVATAQRKTAAKKAQSPVTDRKQLIPRSCVLHITNPRIHDLYTELKKATVEDYKNLCAVGMRVLVELSCDAFLEPTVGDAQLNSMKLAQKLKAVSEALFNSNKIRKQLRDVIDRHADDSKGILAASIFTMNQYVHNPYWHPDAKRLKASWIEIQPFMEALWPSAQ